MTHEVKVDYAFGGGFIPLIVTYDEDEEDWNNNYVTKIKLENPEEDLYDFLINKNPIMVQELLILAEEKMSSKDAKIEGILDDMKQRGEL